MTSRVGSFRSWLTWTRSRTRALVAGVIVVVAAATSVSAQVFCEPLPGTPLFCPCFNFPSGPGRGCDNSAATGGAAETASGSPSISNDTLVMTSTGVGNATASCVNPTGTVASVLIQGDIVINGSQFFDGVRCVGGNLKRIETAFSVSGVFTSSVGISATSASLGDPLAPGFIRYYFLYYRDPCPTYACTGPFDTANVSNAFKITWTP